MRRKYLGWLALTFTAAGAAVLAAAPFVGNSNSSASGDATGPAPKQAAKTPKQAPSAQASAKATQGSQASSELASASQPPAPAPRDHDVPFAPAPRVAATGQASSSPSARGRDPIFRGRTPYVAGTNTFLDNEGGSKEAVAHTVEAARQYVMSRGAGYFAFGPNDDLKTLSSKLDEAGYSYYKYQQTYEGVPVQGRELVVQADRDGVIQMVAGSFQPGIQVDVRPSLSGQVAVNTALNSLADKPLTPATIHYDPELRVVMAGATQQPVLTYRTVVEYQTANSGVHLDEVFVDANKGTLVESVTQMQSALDRSLYDLKQKCLQTGSELPGTYLFGNAGSATADSAAKGAYDNTGLSYWFYYNYFGRDSFDNKGATLKSSVHATFYGGSTCTPNNAFFAGAPYNQMAYGDGDGHNMWNLSSAIDVTAHELGHGITFTTSNLKYKDESGALNEALSDIMGAGAEAWRDSGGNSGSNPATLTPTANTWLVGETIAPKPLRYMNNPTADGQSPDNYGDIKRGTTDNGYVHTNSGIINLAFYLLAHGGTHPRSVTTVNVTGIGIDKALKIYFKANTQLFTSSTDFQLARNLLAQSAETLYGKCSQEWTSVHQSFDAVKVPGTWTACSGTGGGTPTPTPPPTPTPTPAPTPTNLALGASAASSSTLNASYAAGNAVDGKVATAWASRPITSPYQQEWLSLDLKTTKTVKQMTLTWGDSPARNVGVWVWGPYGWMLMKQVTNSSASSVTINLGTLSTRGVTVTLWGGTYYRPISVKELTLQ
jgi:bacillolysin